MTSTAEATAPAAARSRRDARARWELGVYTSLAIGLSGATIVITNIWVDLPPAKVFQQCVRFALTCALLWWLWRGSPTAKWICVVLFTSAGVLGLLAGLIVIIVRAGGDAAPATGFAILLAFMQATYLPFALRLAIPGSAVSQYLRRQGQRRRDRRAEADPA